MNRSISFRHLDSPSELMAAFDIMLTLRPHLTSVETFAAQIHRQQSQGYRLLAGVEHAEMTGLAGYRLQENLIYGRFIYVDDLVVVQARRRSGSGSALLAEVRRIAREAACDHFVLDTGLHMALAQRFYYRQGMLARGLHFVEPLLQGEPSLHGEPSLQVGGA